MKKYAFLLFFTIAWAVISPFASFWLLDKTEESSHVPDTSLAEVFTPSIDSHKKEEIFFSSETPSESQTELSIDESETEITTDKIEKKEITISKSDFKEIVTELCPTVILDTEKIIKEIKYDDDQNCQYITVGNCAISAEALTQRINLDTLSFQIIETESFISFKEN